QQQQQAQQAQQQLQYLSYELQRLRSQPAPQPVPQVEQPKSKWQALPEWNPAFEQFLTTDANGNIVAVPGADPTLPQKYREYKQAEKAFISNLGQKGPDILWEGGLSDRVEQ